MKKKPMGKGSAKKGRTKMKRENADEEERTEGVLDSDDGDEEGLEIDYISDSGSDSE